MSFSEFFQTATGNQPYPYQSRLATGDPASSTGAPCQSRLLDIPTGLGKTAAVTLAWLWNRVALQRPDWPRRLVYCLPMRTLVEQTADNVAAWLANLLAEAGKLGLDEAAKADLACLAERSPVILMGGEELDPARRDWDLYPEKPAILIGTQDMLLSRALNRGYGMSRHRWPIHFALLNNDCLWIMDEVQLMGAGLAATAQLEGFRSQATNLGSHNTHSWWMSATIRPDWLHTVDFPKTLTATPPLSLSDQEKHDGSRVEALRTAPKPLNRATTSGGDPNIPSVAAYITTHRTSDHLNLVVVNTVSRARALHAALAKALGKNQQPPLLLHSQFLPGDRARVLDAIRTAGPGRIVVSTQVIEAGVDLSAHTLFTELAPWSSLVQRFGRCNRWLDANGHPHFTDAHIHWFDLDETQFSAPYDPAQLTAARNVLNQAQDASIATLESLPSPDADRPVFRHVVRRKDFLELFDTTPDLAGADLDIDRFVRDADSSNVHVFWRNWAAKTPNGNPTDGIPPESAPRRDELCPTGIGQLKALLEKSKDAPAWRWSFLDREWQPVKPDALIPGQTYLLHTTHGGYDPDLGWTGKVAQAASLSLTQPPQAASPTLPASNEDDDASESATWQTLAQHTEAVCLALDDLLHHLGPLITANNPPIPILDSLRHAARWHDWGKSHPAFRAKLDQKRIQDAQSQQLLPADLAPAPVAKAPEDAWIKGRLPKTLPDPSDPRRRHFRHELASALSILHPGSGFPLPEGPSRDLAAYLAASHHGKVRLSIRSLPDEYTPPADPAHPSDRRFARGLWDGDTLPACDLGGGVTAPALTLSLEPMELGLCEAPPFTGQPSWAERALTLRDSLGPFLLAYLEALLRAADARASRQAVNTTPAPRP